ncbi:MAG: globin domain-containing protein [Pirellulales bacterium]
MDISTSIERILLSRDLLGSTFYDVFFRRHPEVQRHFEGVNLVRQGVLLTMALVVIEQFHAHAYPATHRYLQYLGTRHDELGIPAETYPHFRDALLETLGLFHAGEWNAELADDWRAAIDKAYAAMLEGYRKHVGK